MYISKLADPKTSFSIITSPRYRGGRYSFSWIVLLTLDSFLIMMSVMHFLSFWYDLSWD